MIPSPSNIDIAMMTWDPNDREPVKQMIETLAIGLGDPQTKDDDSFYWKHIENPAGHTIFSYAMDMKNNLVVSLIGISPRYFGYNGNRYLCYEAVDASTRPEYGRRGLFSGLFRICLEAGGVAGGHYTYGFPNFNSIRGFLKVGFENIGGMSLLLQPRNCLNIGRTLLAGRRSSLRSYKPIFMENLSNEFEKSFMPGIADILSDVHHPENVLYGERDVELIRWRFFRRPGFTYFPIIVSGGFAIVNMGVRAGLREARIIEIVISSGNHTQKVFRGLLGKISDDLKPDLISTYVSNVHQYYRLFVRNGFITVPSRIHFTTFAHAGMTDILEHCKWEIAGMDIDTQ